MQTEGLHTMGCGLVPQGDLSTNAFSTPMSCSPRRTFHLGLSRPEPRQPARVVATPIWVYPPQLLPPPTWPRVEYVSTIPEIRTRNWIYWRRGPCLVIMKSASISYRTSLPSSPYRQHTENTGFTKTLCSQFYEKTKQTCRLCIWSSWECNGGQWAATSHWTLQYQVHLRIHRAFYYEF